MKKACPTRRTKQMTESQRISCLFESRFKYALNGIVCLCCLTLVSTTLPLHSQDLGGGAIFVKVVPKDYNGPCPVVVQFQATIFDGMANAKLRYYWERGDGKSTPQRSGEMRDGKLDVSDEFSVGVPGHTFVATDRLHILFDGYREEVVPPKIETQGTCTPKPDDGSFVRNTYRNDFFGFSYVLPGEWHESRVAPAALPPGAYYLFIGDRDTGRSLLNLVMVVADPESKNRPGISTQEYLSAFIRAQGTDAKAEVIRESSSFVSGGGDFYRADYKRAENGITKYSSMVCTKRYGYWLSWNFVTPSQQDLDDAVNTLQDVSFDRASPR